MHSWIGGGVAGTGQVPGGENGLEGLDGGLSCLGARGCAWLRGPTRSRLVGWSVGSCMHAWSHGAVLRASWKAGASAGAGAEYGTAWDSGWVGWVAVWSGAGRVEGHERGVEKGWGGSLLRALLLLLQALASAIGWLLVGGSRRGEGEVGHMPAAALIARALPAARLPASQPLAPRQATAAHLSCQPPLRRRCCPRPLLRLAPRPAANAGCH